MDALAPPVDAQTEVGRTQKEDQPTTAQMELAQQAAEAAVRMAMELSPVTDSPAESSEPIKFSEAIESVKSPDSKWLLATLNEYFKDWESVRYRHGGTSKRGVDCSGFVYLTFLHQLGVKLPRNTRSLVHLGHSITQDELQTGDLVFFKTGATLKHVGIYLEKGLFMHASTHQGVTMSSLEDRYWSNTYWTARRLNIKIG
jgi:probable lipoprotein NlpC